jgi:DNA-binding NarL/FixJ family response regulator
MSKTRILLADDHPNLLETVRDIIEPCFEVVGSVGNGSALLKAAAQLNPDVILTDISMPILNGIEAVKRLKESGCQSKIVFLTLHSEHEFVRACFEAGAAGYVLKTRMASDVLNAIQTALEGRIFVSPNLAYKD